MESTNVESQEPLLHDQTETSSKLKQEALSRQAPFSTGSKRPYRDSIFTFLFLTTVLTTFTFGIIASTRADTLNMDTKLRLSHFNPTTNKCEITQQQTPEEPDSNSAFVTLAAIAFFISLALTFPLSLLLVSLLRRYTRALLLLSAAITAPFPLVLCVLLFSWCHGLPEGCATLGSVVKQIIVLVALPWWSALLAYKLWRDWTGSAFENGVQALSMATGFLKQHFVLLVVNPVLLMGWMVFVNGPIFLFMWYAFNVGEIVPDFDVVNDPIKGCGLATGISCCREERPGWVYAYITFASFTAFWVLWVSLFLPQLVMGGTVSQWYFAPTGSSTIGNIKRSLRNAYGPSFGIACNLGTVVTILGVTLIGRLKKVSDQVLKRNRQGRTSSILQGCFLRMSQFPECHPEFASTFASISGDSFWESSKKSHTLLLRTSLPSTQTTGSPFHDSAIQTLARMTFICTLLQTFIVYAVLECFSNAVFSTKALITTLCFPIIMIWQASVFLVAVSSVFTTIYICYAMEKDVGEISKPEVCHTLLVLPPSLLPENGVQLAGSLPSEVHHHPAKASNGDASMKAELGSFEP